MSVWEMKARWHYCWGRVCERVGDESKVALLCIPFGTGQGKRE